MTLSYSFSCFAALTKFVTARLFAACGIFRFPIKAASWLFGLENNDCNKYPLRVVLLYYWQASTRTLRWRWWRVAQGWRVSRDATFLCWGRRVVAWETSSCECPSRHSWCSPWTRRVRPNPTALSQCLPTLQQNIYNITHFNAVLIQTRSHAISFLTCFRLLKF